MNHIKETLKSKNGDAYIWLCVIVVFISMLLSVLILYMGLLSSGLAYTLQIIAQRDLDPTLASLLMSLESVFAALFGAIFLGERLLLREWLGGALVFAAVVLSQLSDRITGPKRNS